jgi:hypothetical protein
MTHWYRNRGDVGDTIKPYLDGIVDLIGATSVSATLSGCDAVVELTGGTVVDAVARLVSIPLGSWITTATPGTYEVKTHVDFGPGLRLSWPAAPASDKLTVDS